MTLNKKKKVAETVMKKLQKEYSKLSFLDYSSHKTKAELIGDGMYTLS